MHGILNVAMLSGFRNQSMECSIVKPFVRVSLRLLQVLFFIAVWLATDWVVHIENLSVPTGVVGLFMVSILLFTGIMRHGHIESGAQWLLAEMPLFFIPPLLSITEFGPVFARYGLSLLAAVLIGSIFVMSCTGLIVDRVFHLESRLCGGQSKQR